MNHRTLVIGFALAGLLAGSTFAAPETKHAAPSVTQVCEGCVKASSKKGEVGYCDHCGIFVAHVSHENSKKAIEALEKAGYKDAHYKDGLLCVKADKKDAEHVQKALEGLL